MVYFLTFNCYGSWLPGDERGWVEPDHGIRDPNSGLHKYCQGNMADEPYLLDLPRANIVLTAIQEVCRFRNWDLIAAHVRTNHVHLIVDGLQEPDRAIVQFKASATRALRAKRIWARGGSTRALTSRSALDQAIRYVIAQQGESMALVAPPVKIRQQTRKQTDRGQERAELVHEVDAIAVG
jgi:hypothetical protein